jgi:hypothetical protein
MKIKEFTFQMGNDFSAIYECEHCKNLEKRGAGYHDSYYHTHVIPSFYCLSCGKNRVGKTKENYETA